jgi:hypothetical protein
MASYKMGEQNVNKEITINCKRIIDENITWNRAKDMFSLHDGNLQKVYLRYILIVYNINKATLLVNEDNK